MCNASTPCKHLACSAYLQCLIHSHVCDSLSWSPLSFFFNTPGFFTSLTHFLGPLFSFFFLRRPTWLTQPTLSVYSPQLAHELDCKLIRGSLFVLLWLSILKNLIRTICLSPSYYQTFVAYLQCLPWTQSRLQIPHTHVSCRSWFSFFLKSILNGNGFSNFLKRLFMCEHLSTITLSNCKARPR